MLPTEFRKLIVDVAERQLVAEGYELIGRTTPLPEVALDEYKPTSAAEHRCALSVHVSVVSADPLAATLTIVRRLEGGDAEFEQPVTVRPTEAEARVRAALAVAIAKSGEIALSRVLSLVPVQAALLQYLGVRDAAHLLHANRAVRAALSTKTVDTSYWRGKFARDFPGDAVDDASSSTAYRRQYCVNANRDAEEKRNRRAHRPRIIDSPDLLDDPLRVTPPTRPPRPHAPDPDMPQGPLGRNPDFQPHFPFNPLYPQPNPLMDPRMGGGPGDPRLNPFGGGYGYDVMPSRPGAPRGFPRRQSDNNDYI